MFKQIWHLGRPLSSREQGPRPRSGDPGNLEGAAFLCSSPSPLRLWLSLPRRTCFSVRRLKEAWFYLGLLLSRVQFFETP